MLTRRAKLFIAGVLMAASSATGCTNVKLSAWCNETGSAYCSHCQPQAVPDCLAAYVPSCLAGRDPNMVTNRKRSELEACANDMRNAQCSAMDNRQIPQSCQPHN